MSFVRSMLNRLKEILRRQDPPAWSPDYRPAILAERNEAPSRSRALRVFSPKLGRECHVLSAVELRALLLALYHPDVFEVHEQRMLAMEPRPHPLDGHPRAAGMVLAPVEGTISVAARLDYLHLHPWVAMEDDDGESLKVPYPWIGDLLIFLADEHGPYCVNWTVKATAEGFSGSIGSDRPVRDPKKDASKSCARHAIEEMYYRDAGIRTVRVTRKDIPDALDGNLRRLYLSLGYKVDLPTDTRRRVLDRLQGCLLTGQPPFEALLAMSRQFDVDVPALKAFMEQAIWHRQLRVELCGDPIFADRPLVPERTDVVRKYAHWFARGEA